ncbi:hypothetical protein [Streptomyces sp. NPDC006527]|jgi:hypothetical protein|uniref:hypothetical protein n=1 Tax=Streptomyces sp. NPDC006527 TaxID=3364749 RepID=UPI0036BCF266
MKTVIRRVSIAVASVAIAGGAILGAGGTASAATSQFAGHAPSSSIDDEPRGGHGDDRHESYDRGSREERDDGRDGRRDRYSNDDHRDHHRTWRYDSDHRGHEGGRHHTAQYRWDGHRLYRLLNGRWIDVTPYRHGAVDHWYVDQLLAFDR